MNVTKFSNSLYFKYNKFAERINDYEKYLNEIENKIDKKFEGKKYLMYLKKKVYEDVSTVSVEKYKNFKFVPVNLKRYEEHFKKFLINEENKSIIFDIIKMYLFMKDSICDSKFYEKSNEIFLKNSKIKFLFRNYFMKNPLKKFY